MKPSILLATMGLTICTAQAAVDSPLFPASDLMRIGVYYYPEAWPSNQWARDIGNIRKLNLEFVHMGEFAWAFMEPQEGHFDFDWLERNIQLCADQGLKVVLCTPSPTPPVWLSQEHPEILMVDAKGRRMQFYDTLPAPNCGKVKAGDQTYDWVSWGEVLEPDSGTTALAHYTDQFYAGGVAAVTHKLGNGTVTYIGVDSQSGGLEAQLIGDEFRRAGVAVENFDDGFMVDWRDGFWIATNFTEKTQRAPIPSGAKVLLGTRDVPTAGVTIWEQ